MNTLLDEIIMLLLCTVLVVFFATPQAGIVAFLLAVILICACWLAHPNVKVVALALACMLPLVLSSWIAFLGLVAYLALHQRSWVVRLFWIVPLVGVTALSTTSPQLAALSVLICAIAVLLAIRDVRTASEIAGLRFAYDEVRERYLNQKPASPITMADPAPTQNYLSDLTKRELAIVRLVAQGKDNHEIAAELFLSEGTIRNHISSVLAKKHLSNRTQLAVAYYQGDPTQLREA